MRVSSLVSSDAKTDKGHSNIRVNSEITESFILAIFNIIKATTAELLEFVALLTSPLR